MLPAAMAPGETPSILVQEGAQRHRYSCGPLSVSLPAVAPPQPPALSSMAVSEGSRDSLRVRSGAPAASGLRTLHTL